MPISNSMRGCLPGQPVDDVENAERPPRSGWASGSCMHLRVAPAPPLGPRFVVTTARGAKRRELPPDGTQLVADLSICGGGRWRVVLGSRDEHGREDAGQCADDADAGEHHEEADDPPARCDR